MARLALDIIEPFDVRERTTPEILSLVAGKPVKFSGTLAELSKMTTAEMGKTLEIGREASLKIKAALELASRQVLLSSKSFIRSGEDVAEYFWTRLSRAERESFWVLTLSAKHEVIDCHRISEGTLSMTPVHPREVFSRVIRDSASAVIFCHNHPSGFPEPSSEDRDMTERLCAGAQIFGIRVLDHVVVGRNGYVSFQERNLLPMTTAETWRETAKCAAEGAMADAGCPPYGKKEELEREYDIEAELDEDETPEPGH